MEIYEAMMTSLDAQTGYLSDNTIRAYEHGLKTFTFYLEEHGITLNDPVSSIGMELFVHTPMWLLKKFSKSTALVYWSGINSFFKWLVLESILDPSYHDRLRLEDNVNKMNRKKESKLSRFPEEDDVEKILDAARVEVYESPIHERNIALVEFLASSGCRVNEACQLEIKDIDSKIRYAIVEGKGNKERRVFINRRAQSALRAYWEARGFASRSHPVFTRHDKGVGKGKNFRIKPISVRTADNVVKGIATLAGIEQFTPHYFRHAFAIKALSETGNLALVQDLLGHASPDATRIYAKIRPADLERAHRKIFD